MLQLTDDNYYSLNADRAYMSYSQYKNFKGCEARAMAKLAGWKEESSINMLMGSFVHAWNEGEEAFAQFPKNNPDIFTGKGELKAQFKDALKMIDTLKGDRLIQLCLSGEKEQIITAEFAGCWWKSKLDVLDRAEGKFADLKTARSLSEKFWDNDNRVWVSFIQWFGYVGQMALYQEIERLDAGRDTGLDPYMAIVTGEDPPDKIVISFGPDDLADELLSIKEHMPHILEVKNGLIQPRRCEKCAYCRETKVLPQVFDFHEMEEIYLLGRSFEEYRREA